MSAGFAGCKRATWKYNYTKAHIFSLNLNSFFRASEMRSSRFVVFYSTFSSNKVFLVHQI